MAARLAHARNGGEDGIVGWRWSWSLHQLALGVCRARERWPVQERYDLTSQVRRAAVCTDEHCRGCGPLLLMPQRLHRIHPSCPVGGIESEGKPDGNADGAG